MSIHTARLAAAVLALSTSVGVPARGATQSEYLLLDDFQGGSGQGRSWRGFTDRVMGGVSDMSAGIVRDGGLWYLSMSGTVSTRNNGGFIQVRRPLGTDFSPFDGTRYAGIRIVARGRGDGYYVHIRTAGMLAPWKYYVAPLPVTGEWTAIDIPWSAFHAGDFGIIGAFRPNRLKSLAIVAAKKDFQASVDVREVGLYVEAR